MGTYPTLGYDPHAPSHIQGHCPMDSNFRLGAQSLNALANYPTILQSVSEYIARNCFAKCIHWETKRIMEHLGSGDRAS